MKPELMQAAARLVNPDGRTVQTGVDDLKAILEEARLLGQKDSAAELNAYTAEMEVVLDAFGMVQPKGRRSH